MRRQVIPKFESNLACKIFQTENVTLGNIGIMRTQKANPNYSVMMMDDVGVPIAKGEGLIDRLPKDKIPNLAKVFPSFVYNDGYGAAFAISTVSAFGGRGVDGHRQAYPRGPVRARQGLAENDGAQAQRADDL